MTGKLNTLFTFHSIIASLYAHLMQVLYIFISKYKHKTIGTSGWWLEPLQTAPCQLKSIKKMKYRWFFQAPSSITWWHSISTVLIYITTILFILKFIYNNCLLYEKTYISSFRSVNCSKASKLLCLKGYMYSPIILSLISSN